MEKLIQFLSSYKATIILLLIYSVGLALATLVEKQMSSEAAKMLVYYSPLFIFLQFLLVLNFILLVLRKSWFRQKKWALLVIHFALVIIMAGALTTFLFGKEGQVHIREGERASEMVMHTSKGVKTEKLPFDLELVEFTLNRYPGSQSPSSYESELKIHVDGEVMDARVFMNNVLDLKGYRFFQASYDQDEMGTVLSVNSDVAGRTITYSGYLLLMIGFIMMFAMPNSRFRKLLVQLKETREQVGKIGSIVILLLIPVLCYGQVSAASGNVAETVEQNVVPAEHAARFGSLPVQFRGRVMPMNTFSSEVLRKIHKEQNFGSLNSDQFLLSLFALPRIWMSVPVIAVTNEEVRLRYNLPEKYASYSHFFDEHGHYRLLAQLQEIHHRPVGERSSVDKELINLDERVNIMYQLINQNLPGIFPLPGDPAHTWYAPGDDLSHFQEKDSLFINQTFSWYLSEVTHSLRNGDWNKPDNVLEQIKAFQLDNDQASLINQDKLQAEVRYNGMNIFGWSRVGYLLLGGLLLLVVMMQLFKERPWLHYSALALTAAIVLVFIYHITGMGLRWYISGHAPWSNSYETMVYIAWATVLAGLIFGQKSTITLALATLFGGVILFVSGLNWMDPQINTLVPVLKSPWLMFHVAVIVAAYGFFGISFLLGITNLSLMAFTKNSLVVTYRIKELSIINNLSLLVGLALMTAGTFLGAVWANESWGRYWGWDPKETWALITVVVYAIVTHLHMVRKWNNPWIFNLLSVLAFSSVLMTFLGVNYFLSGMHSYGQTDGMAGVFTYIAIAFALVGILGILSWRRNTLLAKK